MEHYRFSRRFTVLTGNYGSGKTEAALNLALQAAEHGSAALIDLDIVNPYFRSGEYAEEMRGKGVRLLMPSFAMTTVDIPALPPEIQSVFEADDDKVIFDVGGDDTGAAALGRYYPSFMAHRDETTVALVVNMMRPLTRTAEEAAELASRIAARARLKIDIIINNTNLGFDTEPGMVEAGEKAALECARLVNAGEVCTMGEPNVLEKCTLTTPVLPVRRMTVPEWMEGNT